MHLISSVLGLLSEKSRTLANKVLHGFVSTSLLCLQTFQFYASGSDDLFFHVVLEAIKFDNILIEQHGWIVQRGSCAVALLGDPWLHTSFHI
jgi:hypothetical protein